MTFERFRPLRSCDGFSLPEVIVAASILSSALAALAGLLVLSVRADIASRDRTYASVLAQQKLEELRTAVTASDFDGQAFKGTDFVDLAGQVVAARAGAAYVRRWSVDALPAHPASALALEVLVQRTFAAPQAPDRCRLATVMRRRQP